MKEICKACGAENEYYPKDIIKNSRMVSCKSCEKLFIVNDFTEYVRAEDGTSAKVNMLKVALFPNSVNGFKYSFEKNAYIKFKLRVYVELTEDRKDLTFDFVGNWLECDKADFKNQFSKKVIRNSDKLMEKLRNVHN